ncbi:hypothetical protein MMC30_003276 [Trapelia coarctata]|nr:hypothetical protein [Trapelia coarctata]
MPGAAAAKKGGGKGKADAIITLSQGYHYRKLPDLTTLFPVLSPRSTLYNNIVFVIVGPEKVKFGVHEGLLVRKSSFFRAALMGQFKEAVEGTVVLESDDPRVFEVFTSWLYTRKLCYTYQDILTHCNSHRLTELYVFGDRYDIPMLRNDAIDALVENWKVRSDMPFSSFRRVYDATPPNNPLRRLLVDMVALDSKIASSVVPHRDSYPVEMLLDILVVSGEKIHALRKGAAMVGCLRWYPTKASICSSYHKHEEGSALCE